MTCVIGNLDQWLFRDMKGGWGKNLDDAAVFRSEKNATKRITAERNIWKTHVEKWKDHPNLPYAVQEKAKWDGAEAVEISFVVRSR
jgi:hypothetical protein